MMAGPRARRYRSLVTPLRQRPGALVQQTQDEAQRRLAASRTALGTATARGGRVASRGCLFQQPSTSVVFGLRAWTGRRKPSPVPRVGTKGAEGPVLGLR